MRLVRSLQTARTRANSGGGNLESGLGSRPRGFESRILRASQQEETAARPRRPRHRFSAIVSVLVSVAVWRGPQEPADSARDLVPDGIRYVLVAAQPWTSTTSPSHP